MVIDQSGRVEETNKITVVALADKKKFFTIALQPKTKKELLTIFRKAGKPRIFPIIVLANIGKNDPAHFAAWRTYKKILKPNLVLKIENFKGVLSGTKK